MTEVEGRTSSLAGSSTSSIIAGDLPTPNAEHDQSVVGKPQVSTETTESVSSPSSERSDSIDENSQEKKRFKCAQCSQGFTRMHNLKSHVLTHTHEKPFTCDRCSSKFRRINDLKRHLKLHTGERPHVCKLCGRRFARGDALIRHVKNSKPCSGQDTQQLSSISQVILDSSRAPSNASPLNSSGSSPSTLAPVVPLRLSHMDMPHYRTQLIGSGLFQPIQSNPDRILPQPIQPSSTSTWRLSVPPKTNGFASTSTPPPPTNTTTTTSSNSAQELPPSLSLAASSSNNFNASTPQQQQQYKNDELVNMNRMLEIRVRALEERLVITEERLAALERNR